jgi:uroporphyrin-III C-methyltransferase/precorrin-2 dehydrogenase/sirohydrochlorin ferrochelatase
MRHLPISLDLRRKTVVVAGGGDAALAKLRLLMKTEARLAVFATALSPEICALAAEKRLRLYRRLPSAADLVGVALVYAASGDAVEDARVADLGRTAGALSNVVDNREGSDFITPAIVDRDPVTVAISTEGSAPVLARRIKAQVEASLPADTAILARIAEEFRAQASSLPRGMPRRRFWSRFFDQAGPQALRDGGEEAARDALKALAAESRKETSPPGFVHLVGAGPGDPDLLTQKARRLLHEADVVIHDRLVSPAVLDLARREARLIAVGKVPGGSGWQQNDINARIVAEATAGFQVVRLKSGDPGVFGRLDEEMHALEEAGIGYAIVPGITAATAAAAAAKASLTQRGRNSALRLLTGQDVNGFAEQDWRALAKPGAAAAIYMGVRAAQFIQARLLMVGADPGTPMCVVENASRPDQTIIATTLANLTEDMTAASVTGPAILFLGIAPRTLAAAAGVEKAPARAASGGAQ